MKPKELVSLRRKPLDGGGSSLFLDYSIDGIRRKEYLKMYLVPEKNKLDKELNKQTLEAAETIRAKRIIDIQKGVAGIPKVSGKDILLTSYIRMQEADYRERGHIEYANTLDKLVKWLEKFGRKVSLRQLDREYLKDFIVYMQKNLAPSTTHVYFCNLNTILNRAYRADIIAENPISRLDPQVRPKRPESHREFLTHEEVKILSETPCAREIVKRAFLFSCFTGLRLSDIETLKWEEIRKTDLGWHVEERQVKTKSIVIVPLSDNALAQLPERGEPEELVWKDLPSRMQILVRLREWVKAAGIKKKVSFHCSRHTFATLAITYGADLYTVKELLGQKDISTTQIYAKVVSEKKVDAVSMIPSI